LVVEEVVEPLQFQDPLVVAEEVVEQYFTAQLLCQQELIR
tara:strand:- start:716 stop:835 length:120 start_codon:yes stop_codon:yes gene_type:complete